jgi:hypothetical protein
LRSRLCSRRPDRRSSTEAVARRAQNLNSVKPGPALPN